MSVYGEGHTLWSLFIMAWDKYKRKYWDVGEARSEHIISLATEPMARLMRAIIRCDAQVYDTFCMEKHLNDSKLKFDNRYCGVILRISLPEGAEEEFEAISNCKLTVPAKITTNSQMEVAMQGQCGYGH